MAKRTTKQQIEERIRRLEAHLAKENPVLLEIVRTFRQLDRIAYRLGFLDRDESYTLHVSWWPLISVLGTFSAGKSSFINYYLGKKVQSTGNQAVDDKFTVICYGGDDSPKVLPGLALDADPRFPFYEISEEIETVASGEGRKIDSYLQLKTCRSDPLKGKIFIDSPGFDADDQRTSTLRITNHIINLSDLVLVMFDARHPEPKAMQDTLEYLVSATMNRPDSTKFLYTLNQIDTCAREDNPEEVFAAWQRALTQKGLIAGRFYSIYNPQVAAPFPDESLRTRFEAKRAVDMTEIAARIQQLEIDRAYRIVGVLEKTGKTLENDLLPQLREAKRDWRRRVLKADSLIFGSVAVVLFGLSLWLGYWQGFQFNPPWLSLIENDPIMLGLALAAVISVVGYVHFSIRGISVRSVIEKLKKTIKPTDKQEALIKAFRKNTRFFHSVLSTKPAGWGRRGRKRLERVFLATAYHVQRLNDMFTDPSGEGERLQQQSHKREQYQKQKVVRLPPS